MDLGMSDGNCFLSMNLIWAFRRDSALLLGSVIPLFIAVLYLVLSCSKMFSAISCIDSLNWEFLDTRLFWLEVVILQN